MLKLKELIFCRPALALMLPYVVIVGASAPATEPTAAPNAVPTPGIADPAMPPIPKPEETLLRKLGLLCCLLD